MSKIKKSVCEVCVRGMFLYIRKELFMLKFKKTRNRYIETILEKRKTAACAEKRKAQIVHFLTNDEFFLDEMCYWQDICDLNKGRMNK